ncbi:MAG: C45 family peptidase [Deltaproteobacteria bacterium]|jgi:isopenicillin-N N-acyltransferase-like protein|nr:C45 family peptidase [Deltaproteobacteria bacterium]
MENLTTIPILNLSGQGRVLGQAHGEALRDKIREFYGNAMEIHAQNIPVGVTRRDLLDFARRNLSALKRYSPILFEEMEGIARGADLDFDEILFLNSFLEFEDLRPPALGAKLLAKPLWGCTTLNILPAATKEGKTFVAQTYDMEPFYSRYNVILKINRPTGKEIIYTLAGVLGLNGLNNRGLGLVINKLVATDARAGVIYPFIVRQALAQDRLGDAFGAIVFAPRATGMNYQLSSSDGFGFCLELSAGQYYILPFDGAIAHTNHYLADFMRRFETPNWLSHGGSYVRREVASKYLKNNFGQIDLKSIMDLTKDHTNHPRCICAHFLEGEKETTACATIAAVILDLNDKTMYACHGNPCQNPYIKIAFD